MAGGSFFHIRPLPSSDPSSLIPHNPRASNSTTTPGDFRRCCCVMPTIRRASVCTQPASNFWGKKQGSEKTKEPSSSNSTASCRTMFLLKQCKDSVTNRFFVVNNESALFVFFLGREKGKWRRLHQKEKSAAQFCHNSFWKSPSRLEQKLCTRCYAIMPRKKIIAGLRTPRLRHGFLAA